MHGLLTALGRGFKRRIGWKRLGIAASLLIIAFAVTTLVRTLKGVDTGVILVALTELPPHRIALAALCVVGAFCTLTFYDFFALRTIGKKHVPYRIAARSNWPRLTRSCARSRARSPTASARIRSARRATSLR
jgi:hypothetical protein